MTLVTLKGCQTLSELVEMHAQHGVQRQEHAKLVSMVHVPHMPPQKSSFQLSGSDFG